MKWLMRFSKNCFSPSEAVVMDRVSESLLAAQQAGWLFTDRASVGSILHSGNFFPFFSHFFFFLSPLGKERGGKAVT